MKCPSCGYVQRAPDRTDCEACGLIFTKWKARQEGTDLPSLPSRLEIHGNVYTGYFWIDFMLREAFWILILLSLMVIINLKLYSIFWFLFPIVLSIFQILFLVVLWVPRKLAVLTPEHLEFASPASWAFFIPKWSKTKWSEVVQVKSTSRVPWARLPYVSQVTVDVRVSGSEKTKSFSVQSLNPNYLEFIKFLSVKVDPLKMEAEIRDLVKPEKMKAFTENRDKGAKLGLIYGGVFVLVYFLVKNLFYKHQVWGLPITTWILFPMFIILPMIIRHFTKPPDSES